MNLKHAFMTLALSGAALGTPAHAVGVYDGLTLNTLGTMITDMGVTVSKQSDQSGKQFLFIEYKGLAFLADTMVCKNDGVCGGVNFYFLDRRGSSLGAINTFNSRFDFIKVTSPQQGGTLFESEHMVAGGITELNVQLAFYAFAQGLRAFEDAANGQTSSRETTLPQAGFSGGVDTKEAFGILADGLLEARQANGKRIDTKVDFETLKAIVAARHAAKN